MKKVSSAFMSTRRRARAGRTEFRYAAFVEGSSLKRLLVEVIAKNPRRKVGGRLDVTFVDEVCGVGETQATCMTDELKDVQTITFTC